MTKTFKTAWDRIENNAILTDPETGQKFTLYHNGDLWLIPEGYDKPDFFEC